MFQCLRSFMLLIADQWGNNRTASNVDADTVILGRLVTSAEGPYPETAAAGLLVSAFQSIVAAQDMNSGFYLGRYVMQRTSLRMNHFTYLRASIGDVSALRDDCSQLTVGRTCRGYACHLLRQLEQPLGPGCRLRFPCGGCGYCDRYLKSSYCAALHHRRVRRQVNVAYFLSRSLRFFKSCAGILAS